MPLNKADHLASTYFQDVLHAYQRAEVDADGPIIRDYKIGNRSIKLVFAGDALLRHLTPAIQHLATSDNLPAELEIYIWDNKSTGIEIPPSPWDVSDIISRGEIWRFESSQFKISYSSHNHSFFLLNVNNNSGIYYTDSSKWVSQHDCGAPLLQILKWWFDHHQAHILHAAAIGTSKGAVLLVGKGGSGKSTTALTCLDAGLTYLGDDYSLLINQGKPTIYSLYCSGKVDLENINWFPSFADDISPHEFPEAEKALFLFHPSKRSQLTTGLPIKAVLIPKINHELMPKLTRISPAQAFVSLAPSTILQFRGSDNQALSGMSKLVRQVPCYELSLSDELSTIPTLISTLLEA